MNKAITDGLVLMPPAFENGLAVWSSGDGTPGSDTYDGSGNGVFVPADQDFGGCLEILKNDTTTKLRYMGETPLLPGCYLQIRARIKAMSGNLPSVRVAGWAGGSGGAPVTGLTSTGTSVALTSYGDIVEVSAIVGTGPRTGVDMVWTTEALYGHFGIDLTGANGGVVRVDDIEITDVTNVFQRDMMASVDVRDFGAVGDGVTDDVAAFEAADAAAAGREIIVPAGTYYLGSNVTIDNRIRFEGSVVMPDAARLVFLKNYDLPTYIDAFGNDEPLAFRKAFQALLNFTGHESLDLGGRRIQLTGPIDMQAAEGSKTSFATRRVIRNGQFEALTSTDWDTVTVTSQASYSTSDALRLTGVVNVANVQVGSLVEGTGVGREIYVTDVDFGQQTVDLSQPLYDAEGTQTFTFKRFQYMLDFSGFSSLSQFVLDDIDFQCQGKASGIMLAKQGVTFHLRDCFVTKPMDRGLTSPGRGCQGLLIDRCQFISNEQSLPVASRTTIAFNANANDVKIRDNRVAMFKHFCILGGSGNLVTGNHWFHGDNEVDGVRMGGIVFATPNPKSILTGNYIDNNFIEWTNEYDETPALGVQFSFGGMTITGNCFTANDVASWFNWIVIKPYGPDHFIHGLSVTGNVFRTINGFIDRVEHVDTTFANLDRNRMRNVVFSGNTFHGVNEEVQNPASLDVTQSALDRIWIAETQPHLPFGGWARNVESVVADDKIADAANNSVYDHPWVDTAYGPDKTQVRFVFESDCTGTLRYIVRMDNPM